MPLKDAKCPLCSQPSKEDVEVMMAGGQQFTILYIECSLCDRYSFHTDSARIFLPSRPTEERQKVASYLFERKLRLKGSAEKRLPVILIYPEPPAQGPPQPRGQPPPAPHLVYLPWDEILKDHPATLSDKLDRGLVNLLRMSEAPGSKLPFPSSDVNLAMYAPNSDVAAFLVEALEMDGYVKTLPDDPAMVRQGVRVEAQGWKRVADLQRGGAESNTAFLACCMGKRELFEVVEPAFRKACAASGFEPVIINEVEHIDKICDRIIAEIRKARFLVCDMTDQRQNVYYEAGFGQGLGLPVIWTCRDDEKNLLHMDTRQYNHILWLDGDDLAKKLLNRIHAVIR